MTAKVIKLKENMMTKQSFWQTVITFCIGIVCGGLVFKIFAIPCVKTTTVTTANEINHTHVYIVIVQSTQNVNDTPVIRRLLDGEGIRSTVIHCGEEHGQDCDNIGDTRLSILFLTQLTRSYDWLVLTDDSLLGTRSLIKMLTTFQRWMPIALIYPNCDSISLLILNRRALSILIGNATMPELYANTVCESHNKIDLYSLQKVMVTLNWTHKESSFSDNDLKIPISQFTNETSLSSMAIKHLKGKLQKLRTKTSNLKQQINMNIKQTSLQNVLITDSFNEFPELKEWDFVNVSLIHSLGNNNGHPREHIHYKGRQLLFNSTHLNKEADNQSCLSFAYQRITSTKGVEHLQLINDSSRYQYYRTIQSYDGFKFREIKRPKHPNIVLVLPLYKRADVFARFLKRLLSVAVDFRGGLALQVVLYKDRGGEYVRTIQTAHDISGRVIVHIVNAEGHFTRSKAIGMGITDLPDTTRMLLIDVDMMFTEGFLQRVVQNTIQGSQVFFPIYFSRYDPRTVQQKLPGSSTRVVYHQDFGTWRYFSFGIVGIYKSDLIKLGHFDLRISGWGKEDVSFYDKCVLSDLAVYRAVDPGLWHMYHKRVCDRRLQKDQREMCRQSRLQLQSSQRSLADYVLQTLN